MIGRVERTARNELRPRRRVPLNGTPPREPGNGGRSSRLARLAWCPIRRTSLHRNIGEVTRHSEPVRSPHRRAAHGGRFPLPRQPGRPGGRRTGRPGDGGGPTLGRLDVPGGRPSEWSRAGPTDPPLRHRPPGRARAAALDQQPSRRHTDGAPHQSPPLGHPRERRTSAAAPRARTRPSTPSSRSSIGSREADAAGRHPLPYTVRPPSLRLPSLVQSPQSRCCEFYVTFPCRRTGAVADPSLWAQAPRCGGVVNP